MTSATARLKPIERVKHTRASESRARVSLQSAASNLERANMPPLPRSTQTRTTIKPR